MNFPLKLCFAYAQTNAAGSIFGTTDRGDTVVIESQNTGFTREIQVDSEGRFTATSLPTGEYTVRLVSNGETVATVRNVLVRLGAGTRVSFEEEDVAELQRVEVTGGSISPIDVSTTDTRTVFTSDQLARITVGRTIQEVALLTPGVVEADSRYPGSASFGGSAASENAFYINGYAVTNPLTNIGSTTLPFDSISQFQAITGGYGAEFGRATGGVVNIITKSGSNDYEAGAYLFWEPESLRAEERNIYFPHNGTPVDGQLYQRREIRELDSITYGVYASGPIVKDKLFFYANVEYTDESLKGPYAYPGSEDGFYDIDYEIPRYLLKFDWNITNNHLLDLTVVSDVTKETDSYYPYFYTGDNAHQRGSNKTGGFYYEDGGELYVLNYTGYLTNDLTLTAMYGTQKSDHIAIPYGYDPSVVYVSDTRTSTADNPVQAGLYSSIPVPDAYDETEGYRIDLEWRVGDHQLRFGYDRQDSESKTGTITSGPAFIEGSFGTSGYRWIYEEVPVDFAGTTIPGSGGAAVPADRDYVVRYIYANGGQFKVEQSAFYLEDRWYIGDWLLSLGLRNESFTNYNADGIPYAEQNDQWAPRIGATWDVYGDSSLKVFGQVGRYHLAMPMNVAVRAASGSYYTREYFEFESIDPQTGVPQGLTPLGDGPYSANNEYGQAPDPATVAASDLDSHFQDELVIGFEKLLAGTWNFGARWVYRDLKSAIDDMCDGRPGYRYAIANGFSEEDALAFDEQLQGCRMFNPGESNTFRLLGADGETIHTLAISADDMGFPKLKRTYSGVDVFIEYPFDGTWYYKVDYTWSKNYGNAEGQLKSDIGQQDVSLTQDWDHPELMEFANGYLPNHREHYLKAFGFYQMNPEWRFSGTFIAHSGRPKNCFGYYSNPDVDPDFSPYAGPYYFYCDGKPSPRGSHGNLPWTMRLDLGVAYAPAMFNHRLQFGLDVFNVTDRQTAQNIIEYGELGGPGGAYTHTNRVISYSDPRTVRFSVRYDF